MNRVEKSKGKLNNLVALSGIGLQMGVTIFLGAYLGKYLDNKYPSDKKWFTMICILLSVAISLYSLIQQLNKINRKDKSENSPN